MKTADLLDLHEESAKVCSLTFLKFGQKRSFGGSIHTVKCFEDNVLLRDELQKPGNGRVMIVDGGGSTSCALLGDQMAVILQDNGWAGIVINGAIRDCDEIAAMTVGVFCIGVNPRKSGKRGRGEVGASVRFGGVTFNEGAFAYCDADGVVVSAAALTT